MNGKDAATACNTMVAIFAKVDAKILSVKKQIG